MNFNLDGSETGWLIYADWLEDNNKDNSLVKFGLNELIVNQWCYEYKIYGVGVRDIGIDVGVGGGCYGIGNFVGSGIGIVGIGVGCIGVGCCGEWRIQ